ESQATRTSERTRERERERGDQSRMGGRHRHNVYIVWLSPNTKVCMANESGKGQETARTTERESGQKSTEISWENLEIGDHVEIMFTRREGTDSTGAAAEGASSGTSWSRKHGRHRTYFGDATSITILPESESHHYGYSSERGRGEDKGSRSEQ